MKAQQESKMKTTAQATVTEVPTAQYVEIVLERAASFADAAERCLDGKLPFVSLRDCCAALEELNRLTGEWSDIIRIAAKRLSDVMPRIPKARYAEIAADNSINLVRHVIKCYESGSVRVGIDEVSVEQLIDDMAKEEKAKVDNRPATVEGAAAESEPKTTTIKDNDGGDYEIFFDKTGVPHMVIALSKGGKVLATLLDIKFQGNMMVGKVNGEELCVEFDGEALAGMKTGCTVRAEKTESRAKEELLKLMQGNESSYVTIRTVIQSCLLPDAAMHQWMFQLVTQSIRRALDRSGCHYWESWAINYLSGRDRSETAAQAAVKAVHTSREFSAAEVAARAAVEAARGRERAAEVAFWAAAMATTATEVRAECEHQYRDLLGLINTLPDKD